MKRFFSTAAVSAWTLAVTAGAPTGDGALLFTKHCALCHGKDGKARTPVAKKLGVKDLTESKIPDAEIVKQIKEGKKGEDGKQKMPPFEGKLSDAELKLLVTVVKELRP